MLGIFVVLYLFLGGCGAAVLGIAAIWSLLFSHTLTRSGLQSHAFAMLRGCLYAVSFAMLVVAALCLLFDLGRPDRMLLLFTRPTMSLITVGSFVLLACLAMSGFLAVANLLLESQMPSAVRKAVEALSLVPSLVMIVYTGLYMAWMEAVPLWSNGALPWLFALSSLSSGLSLVFVAMSFARDWKLLSGWVRALRRLHCVVLVLEAVALGAFVALAVANPFAAASLAYLLDPAALGPWFVVGFGVLGLAVPLAAEFLAPSLKNATAPLFAEVLSMSGGLILRFCLVLAGSHWLG